MKLTELIDYIDRIPSSTLLVGMIVLGVVVGWFLSNRKDIKELWDSWYQRRKRKDELLEMLLSDHDRMGQYEENRKSDRAQSFDIQKQLVDAQEKLAGTQEELAAAQKELANTLVELKKTDEQRDKMIDSVVVAVKEMMCDRINQKYKHYISIGGIPEDEISEFESMHRGYNLVGGNSSGDAKYAYVKEHLPIIPVETILVLKNKDEH